MGVDPGFLTGTAGKAFLPRDHNTRRSSLSRLPASGMIRHRSVPRMDANRMPQRSKLTWASLYTEVELYKSAVRLYTKPLFNPVKARSTSSDEKTLFDFAKRGLHNLHHIHRALSAQTFAFRPGRAHHRNFNGKLRTLYIYPWEERLVSLLLYRALNRRLDSQLSTSCYAYRWKGYGVDRCQQAIAQTLRRIPKPFHVMKRDISNFFPSIDHTLLIDRLRSLVEPDDYLFQLLSQCVRFRYHDQGVARTADRGVPFGTASACLLANLYLLDLDRRLEAIPGITFFRYADDLLVLSSGEEGLCAARRVFADEMTALKLTSNQKHETESLLGRAKVTGNSIAGGFRHLGLQFREDGSIGLSRDKFRKIRNLFRFAFRRRERKFRLRQSLRSRAQLAIQIAQQVLSQGIRNVAIIDYYLRHVTDEQQLRQLDRWLAEEVLSRAFQGGHKKSYFKKMPYAKLRKMGLPSLVHRRRLIRHGHIESTFFVWKSHQSKPRYGARAARPQSREAAVFSQSPEAVVKSTW